MKSSNLLSCGWLDWERLTRTKVEGVAGIEGSESMKLQRHLHQDTQHDILDTTLTSSRDSSIIRFPFRCPNDKFSKKLSPLNHAGISNAWKCIAGMSTHNGQCHSDSRGRTFFKTRKKTKWRSQPTTNEPKATREERKNPKHDAQCRLRRIAAVVIRCASSSIASIVYIRLYSQSHRWTM